jgi:hypothetical protein
MTEITARSENVQFNTLPHTFISIEIPLLTAVPLT